MLGFEPAMCRFVRFDKGVITREQRILGPKLVRSCIVSSIKS